MDQFAHPIAQQLREQALGLPETSEGTSCVNRAFKVRKKNFLFLGEKPGQVRVMLRLRESVAEARDIDDARFSVGNTGWVTVLFPPESPPDVALLGRWLRESYCTLAPKTLARQVLSA